jgi:hypothetical protein
VFIMHHYRTVELRCEQQWAFLVQPLADADRRFFAFGCQFIRLNASRIFTDSDRTLDKHV